MSISTSSKHFKENRLIILFLISLGIVACYNLYRDIHIPTKTLIKNIFLYGAVLTIMIQFMQILYYKISKNIKVSNKKKRKDQRSNVHKHTRNLSQKDSF